MGASALRPASEVRMWIQPLVGLLYHGQHLDPSETYDVDDQTGRLLVATQRARAAPPPPEVIEMRDPRPETRDPTVRRGR